MIQVNLTFSAIFLADKIVTSTYLYFGIYSLTEIPTNHGDKHYGMYFFIISATLNRERLGISPNPSLLFRYGLIGIFISVVYLATFMKIQT